MLEILYPLAALLMLFLPIVAVVLVRRRLGGTWRLVGAGALTFVLSQVVHIPLNAGVAAGIEAGILPRPPASLDVWLLPLALGLSAGLCEEIARWIGYRRMPHVRSWDGAVVYGVGHGGVEALIVAVLAVFGTINLFVLRSPEIQASLPPEQLALVTEQLEAAWSIPPYLAFAGLWERAFAMLAHVSMSVFVLQAFRRGPLWLVVAVAAHAGLDAVAVSVMQHAGVAVTELALAVYVLPMAALAWWLRTPADASGPGAPTDEPPADDPPAPELRRRPLSTDPDRLDEARYR